MKQPKEEPIVYKVQLLEDLVGRQQKLLTTAREIIDGKNRIIELCKLETDLYRRENKKLTRLLIISAVFVALSIALSIIRALS